MSAAAALPEIPKVANQWVLKAFPEGLPVVDQHLEKKSVPLDADNLKDNEVLVKISHISVDPYQRGIMNRMAYGRENSLGQPIFGGSIGTVLVSKHKDFPVGTVVDGNFGWVDAAIVVPEQVALRSIPAEWSRSHALHVLGMPGATALCGIENVLKPREGDVVFVSAAAGAVGSLVGQICKILGCKVYGSVGSDKKVELVKSLGFDGALNYKGKSAEELIVEIKQLTGGKTIDRYFENTGGPVTDAVMSLLSQFARVAICGQISLYNTDPKKLLLGGEGISSAIFMRLLAAQATAEAFLVGQWEDRYERLATLHKWIEEKKLSVVEDISVGFDSVPAAFLQLFEGANTGKKIVQL